MKLFFRLGILVFGGLVWLLVLVFLFVFVIVFSSKRGVVVGWVWEDGEGLVWIGIWVGLGKGWF